MKLLAWPHEHPTADLVGGKAAALAALAGTPLQEMIPPWFCLTKDAFLLSCRLAEQAGKPPAAPALADEVRAALNQAVAQLASQVAPDTRFAVRSSAIGEDSATSSYAGQLTSVLEVPHAEIENAVLTVWQSALKEQVHRYQEHMLDDASASGSLVPAVLIQAMIPAQIAGVGFGADPVSGSRETLVIGACEGLGDKLVSGLVDGDTYYCTRDGALTRQICQAQPLLTPPMLGRVCALLVQLEALFHAPQDVEWAWADDRLWLLQSRPITTLHVASSAPPAMDAQEQPPSAEDTGTHKILWDNSNIVESYSGVTSPLTFSFARYIYENVYTEFCRFMGVSEKTIAAKHNLFRNMLGSINGHVYYNLLNWYEWLTLFPGFTLNRRFMEQMMGVSEALPEELLQQIKMPPGTLRQKMADALRLVPCALGLAYNALVLKRKVRAFNKRLDQALSTRTEALSAMPLDALCAHYRGLEQQLLRHWDAPLINDFLCMMAFGFSRKLLEKYGGEKGVAYHRDMLIGQGDIISAEPARRIRQMAEAASAFPELTAILSRGQKAQCQQALREYPQIEGMVAAYLEKFGDRCLQELKLESPTMADEPGTLFSSIGHLATRLHNGTMPQQQRAVLPPLEAVIGQGWWRNLVAGKVCRWAKNLVSGRENLRFERTRLFGRVRQIFVHIGRHFQRMGLLAEERDIFYLEVPQVLALIEGTATFRHPGEWVRFCKQDYARLAQLPPPPSRLITEGAVFASVAHLSQHVSGDKHEILPDSLQGIACCQGIVRARVRVITDPRTAELKAGEIMVAQFTDPGWITLFANASGILVERGSLLSHSAIVARELNIPAIVGLQNIMQWLQTGDLVEMDGASGQVRKIQPTDADSLSPAFSEENA